MLTKNTSCRLESKQLRFGCFDQHLGQVQCIRKTWHTQPFVSLPSSGANLRCLVHNTKIKIDRVDLNLYTEREGANEKLRDEMLQLVGWCQELDLGRLPPGFQEFLKQPLEG